MPGHEHVAKRASMADRPGDPRREPGGDRAGGGDGGRAGEVAFTIEFHLRPGQEDAFLGLLTPVLDAMRGEPTFINAVLHRDPADPSRFMLYETWADLDDVLEVQVHRAYRKAYMDALPQLLRDERRIAVWQPVRSDFRTVSGRAPGE